MKTVVESELLAGWPSISFWRSWDLSGNTDEKELGRKEQVRKLDFFKK